MNNELRKYAQVILKTCLKIEENQPLFISADYERMDFVRIVSEEAYKLGVKDIYYDLTDAYLKHEALKNLEVADLKKLSFWNNEMWNVYGKKRAAFLMLASEHPGLMKDINPEKMRDIGKYAQKTRKVFDALRDKSELAWCIVAVPTLDWAKELFPKEKNPVEKLWKKIFEICSIDQKNPEKIWNDKINKFQKRAAKLNSYHFKSLKYQSANGTDFVVDLPLKHLWASGNEKLANGKDVLVNFPTEEVFTSPDCKSAQGIVYSSKPLSYQGVVIEDFYITFKNGKAVSCKAHKNQKNLEMLLTACKNSNMLGEVALVPYDSPISQAKIVFLETLFDENAACHLALGDSFPECYEGGPKMDKKDLFKLGMNDCDTHVDFMIGTADLNIVGITSDNREIPVFENGNFTKEFE